MRRLWTVIVVMIALLAPAGYASAAEGAGADCRDPSQWLPFADLRNCDLSGQNMEGVDLSNADLSGANLDNASLHSTTLWQTRFDNASMRGTDLFDGYAPNASFINTDLRGANLYFSFMRDANLSGANLSGMWLNSADFVGSVMQNVNFAGSQLGGVDMRETDLRGADLSTTSLYYVSLNNADLRNANLLGAEREVGTWFTGATWGNTLCADGSNSDDADGDGFTCETNFPANQPPTVTLTAPAPGTTVFRGETIHVSADAADGDGTVIRVEFYAGSTLLVHDVVPPYAFEWTNAAVGSHIISAKAYDEDGGVTASGTVTVTVQPSPTNAPPTVAITAPTNGSTVSRLLGTTIRANASDSNGAVTKVEFYAGGTLVGTDASAPYTSFWRPSSRGNHVLTAKAYDNDGAVTTSSPVNVNAK